MMKLSRRPESERQRHLRAAYPPQVSDRIQVGTKKSTRRLSRTNEAQPL